jgi:hypothetical protein
MLNRATFILLIVCLLLTALTMFLVAAGELRILTMIAHLGALGCGISAVWIWISAPKGSRAEPWIDRQDLTLIGAVALIQLIALLYMQTFPFHYVQDEFITGYTSYTLPSLTEIEWYRGYPAPGEWIAGFPILYYVLQKPFIELFGLSLETIRISTWPYHVLSAALVYLIGKELFRCRPWAVVAAMIYILLAPNLYMSGYGMHNISSTFFFLAAFYAVLRLLRTEDKRWMIAAGLFSALAYLTYTSSYLTLPLIGVLVVMSALFQWSRTSLIRYGQIVFVALLILTPFLAYGFAHHNYFTERGDQVNAVDSFFGDEHVENPAGDLFDHIWLNIQALYTPGIGGVTDYWFGKQALFDWITLGLLLIGVVIAVFRGIRDRSALHLAIVATVLATFVFGMLLTLPAGGFHRTSLAFPFISILIALAIQAGIDKLPVVRAHRLASAAATTLLLTFILLINVSILQTMTNADEDLSSLTDSIPITAFIEDRVPANTEVIISSFPNYHLERELIVRTSDTYNVRIAPFEDAIEHAGGATVVLFQPSGDQIHRLEARYAGGTFIEEHDGHDLKRHVIWIPESVASH